MILPDSGRMCKEKFSGIAGAGPVSGFVRGSSIVLPSFPLRAHLDVLIWPYLHLRL
jgi:hypothetical protein